MGCPQNHTSLINPVLERGKLKHIQILGSPLSPRHQLAKVLGGCHNSAEDLEQSKLKSSCCRFEISSISLKLFLPNIPWRS